MRTRLQDLFAEYGRVAIATYLVIFVVVLSSFAAGIVFGMDVDGAAGGAGTLAAAWVATKVTQPARIAATVVLTPIVAAGLRRWRPPVASHPVEEDVLSDAEPAKEPATVEERA